MGNPMQVLGIVLLALCQQAYSTVICYACNGTSAKVGKTCSYDSLAVCTSACAFSVDGSGSWSTGCSDSFTTNATAQICTYSATLNRTTCLCASDFCNDFDKTVDELLVVWEKAAVTVEMVFPSVMATECFECGQVNITGVGVIVLPCDAAHTCHGDYCITKRGENPHSYCGTVWDGNPAVSCTKMPGQPEVCVCTESFCNPVLDPVQEPTTTAPSTSTTTTTVAAASTTTTAGAAATTTAAPPGATTTHPKCKNGRFTPNAQAVTMGEKLKNIISNAFNAVNIDLFQSGIDDHICNYSYPA